MRQNAANELRGMAFSLRVVYHIPAVLPKPGGISAGQRPADAIGALAGRAERESALCLDLLAISHRRRAPPRGSQP